MVMPTHTSLMQRENARHHWLWSWMSGFAVIPFFESFDWRPHVISYMMSWS